MEVCKAGQPHASVRVREGEGDAVGTGLRARVSPFNVGVHGVRGLRQAVHPGGRHGVLVVVPGDLRQFSSTQRHGRGTCVHAFNTFSVNTHCQNLSV